MREWLKAALVLGLASASPAWAVQPQTFSHTSEADFEPGTFEDTVTTNLGDVKLAPSAKPFGEMPTGVTVVYDTLRIGETDYFAAGPEGTLLKRVGDTVETVLTQPGSQFFTLAEVRGQLVVGLSGAEAKLAVLHEGKLVDLMTLPESQYIWDLARVGGELFVATGPNGKLFKVQDVAGAVDAVIAGNLAEPAGFAEVFDAAQANVLTLANGRDKDGYPLYFGTDTDGIVYRLDRDASVFAVYDAAEPEVGAITVSADGTVYAGTADAEQAKPGRMDAAVKDKRGRPDDAPLPLNAEPPSPPDIDTPEPAPFDQSSTDNTTNADAKDASSEAPAPPTTPEGTPRNADAQGASPEASGSPVETTTAPPTPQQYDALRAAVREKLQTARKTGQLTTATSTSKPTGKSNGNATRATTSPNQRKEGNAVYRIDPAGFVTEVFRESVMVLDLLLSTDGKTLHVATGSEGQLYRVALDTREVTLLRDLDAEQIVTLALVDGQPILGTANPAQLLVLTPDLAEQGTYTSKPFDATQPSLWGKLNLTADVPTGSRVQVQTRTGNLADPDAGPWSPWSELVDAPDAQDPLAPRSIEVSSPPARYLQYRLVLMRDETASPVVDRVDLAYIQPNLPPLITRVADKPPAPPTDPDEARNTTLPIEWDASDPNNDRLTFTLHAQPAGPASAQGPWLKIADNLTSPSFDWQTRSMPDGRYTLRVTASDKLDNPPAGVMTAARRSDPILIDNTPPSLRDLQATAGNRSVTLAGSSIDALSAVRSLAYKLNDADDWTPLLPADLLFDSTTEPFRVTILDLSPGSHVLTVRTSDALGNTAYASQIVTVP